MEKKAIFLVTQAIVVTWKSCNYLITKLKKFKFLNIKIVCVYKLFKICFKIFI